MIGGGADGNVIDFDMAERNPGLVSWCDKVVCSKSHSNLTFCQ